MTKPPVVEWQGSPIRVEARLIPRFLWTTASIDVFVGQQCVLRTGGQMKATGSHSETAIHCGGAPDPARRGLCGQLGAAGRGAVDDARGP